MINQHLMPLKNCATATLVLLISFSSGQAQKGGFNIQDHLLIKEADRYNNDPLGTNYEGSPYLDEQFVEGYVYQGNDKFNGVPMRLNIHADLIEFQEAGITYLLEPDPRITKVVFGGQTFVVDNFKYFAKKGNGFLELLESGRITLLAKKAVSFRKEMPLQGIPAKYSRLPDVLYYRIGDQTPNKFGNIRNLVEDLPDHKEAVRKFVEVEKISVKNPDDVVKLVRFYNSLSPAH
jgi:hypothetical protein